MPLPFFSIMPPNLPDPGVITGQEKYPEMLWISKLSGFDLRTGLGDPLYLRSWIMGFLCRYGSDR
jgi:hypothetical protein